MSELENSESEWMTSRAEQTANEVNARDTRVATLAAAEDLALPTESSQQSASGFMVSASG